VTQPRALTGNAADPEQVKYAERKERQRRARFGLALKTVLGTTAGRLVFWELLSRAGIYRSIWDPTERIHYNAGRQDFGHELLATILETDEDAYLLMEREARAIARGDARETAAVQTPAAGE
jgi:hypothetical protein